MSSSTEIKKMDGRLTTINLTINVHPLYYVSISNIENITTTFSYLSKNYETTLQNSVKNVSWYFVKTQTTFFYFRGATGHIRNESSQPHLRANKIPKQNTKLKTVKYINIEC